ncbi:hypothetical protein FQZ97_1065460 [compost metagenome]
MLANRRTKSIRRDNDVCLVSRTISQCDAGMSFSAFNGDDTTTAAIQRVRKCGAKHLIHLPPGGQRLWEHVLKYDITVLGQRDP